MFDEVSMAYVPQVIAAAEMCIRDRNTDRPEFQKLLGEIRKGKVRRVIVYKLDRISRSILDLSLIHILGYTEPGRKQEKER